MWSYSTLNAFYQATGLEQHAIRIDKDSCFTKISIPNPPPASMPLQYLSLKPDCNAVDKGIPLANINDDCKGAAPDLGAYEVGVPLPHYGPRIWLPPPPPPPGPGSIVPTFAPLLLEKL